MQNPFFNFQSLSLCLSANILLFPTADQRRERNHDIIQHWSNRKTSKSLVPGGSETSITSPGNAFSSSCGAMWLSEKDTVNLMLFKMTTLYTYWPIKYTFPQKVLVNCILYCMLVITLKPCQLDIMIWHAMLTLTLCCVGAYIGVQRIQVCPCMQRPLGGIANLWVLL